LQAIERQLNGQVFVRRSNGEFVPSEFGKALIAAGEKMEAAFLEAKTSLLAAKSPIRVATCEVVAKVMVVSMLFSWSAETRGQADLTVHDNLFALPDDAFDILVTPLESVPDDMVG
jgi:DNA-binding transcriptional LysR family regulator